MARHVGLILRRSSFFTICVFICTFPVKYLHFNNKSESGIKTTTIMDNEVRFIRTVSTKDLISLNIESDDLPYEESILALDAAALRLRAISQRITKCDIPMHILEKNLIYASKVLDKFIERKLRQLTKKDIAQIVPQKSGTPDEVLRWLHLTFSEPERKFPTLFTGSYNRDLLPHTITISMTGPNISQAISGIKTVDNWDFDVFSFASVCEKKPLKMMMFNIMNQYGIMKKYKVPVDVLYKLLAHVEDTYYFYNNPYHNNLHAADTVQTLHFMMSQTGLISRISDLEIFACIMAAFVHDYNHPGTNNAFQVNTKSKLALLYNDNSVLENYHASAMFNVLQQQDFNILQNLSHTEYKKLRYLTIQFILATDMNYHAQFFQEIRDTVSLPLFLIDKVKALSFIMLCCDISHPAKSWELHCRWTNRSFDELWIQGDREKSLGMPISPMCDRSNTNIALCQIGLLENIIQPTFELLNDVLEQLLEYKPYPLQTLVNVSELTVDTMPWKANIQTNLQNWKKKFRV